LAAQLLNLKFNIKMAKMQTDKFAYEEKLAFKDLTTHRLHVKQQTQE
jgi:hypothetical protein